MTRFSFDPSVRSLLLASLFVLVALPAHAATLHLSLSGTDPVQAQVTGADPHTLVRLNFVDTQGVPRTLVLGTADAEGFLSTSVGTAAHQVAPGNFAYVSEDSGPASPSVRWPMAGSTDLSLSVSSLSIPVGQNGSVSVTNPLSTPLAVKSNTDPSAVSVSVAGANSIDLSGLQNGSATVTVCTSDGSDCQDLVVTVGSGGAGAQGLALSQTEPVLLAGGQTSVYISGAPVAYYLSSNSNPSIAQGAVTQNLITLTGFSAGSTRMTVCAPGGACGTLNVQVLAPTNLSGTQPITLSTQNLALSAGENGTVLAATSGSVTADSNAWSIATTTVSGGSHVIVTGERVGTATITICNGRQDCAYVSVSVSPAPPAPAAPSVPAGAQFTTYLKPGMTSSTVLALQNFLTALGFMTVTPNGHFGPATTAAVKAFQKAHGIEQLGVVGPLTRAALNAAR